MAKSDLKEQAVLPDIFSEYPKSWDVLNWSEIDPMDSRYYYSLIMAIRERISESNGLLPHVGWNILPDFNNLLFNFNDLFYSIQHQALLNKTIQMIWSATINFSQLFINMDEVERFDGSRKAPERYFNLTYADLNEIAGFDISEQPQPYCPLRQYEKYLKAAYRILRKMRWRWAECIGVTVPRIMATGAFDQDGNKMSFRDVYELALSYISKTKDSYFNGIINLSSSASCRSYMVNEKKELYWYYGVQILGRPFRFQSMFILPYSTQLRLYIYPYCNAISDSTISGQAFTKTFGDSFRLLETSTWKANEIFLSEEYSLEYEDYVIDKPLGELEDNKQVRSDRYLQTMGFYDINPSLKFKSE